MSTEGKNIHDELLVIQKKIGTMTKDVTNPFYKSQYFDINSLIREVRPVLEEHGIVLTQPIIDDKVYSILTHLKTHQTIESSLKLPEIQDPQKIGSAITYYRRYTLASLLALEAEDDDGNKASAKPKKDDDDKPWLNENDKVWGSVKKSLSTGEKDMKYVLSKFKVSTANLEKLLS